MEQFDVIVYEGEVNHPDFGWDYGNKIFFQSEKYPEPGSAMAEFNEQVMPAKPWFAYMRVTKDGEVTEEQLIDTYNNTEAL